jgi:anthranilate phosphoribosyltransferase
MLEAQIDKVRLKENLSSDEIRFVMETMMSGSAPEEEIASFLLALREKGPTVEEITGAAEIMRQFAVRIPTTHKIVLDTCGTGGDKKHTFNISTITAFVLAGAGVAVAKHGNRSVSSKCGSADVLEALGVDLAMEEQNARLCLDDLGIVFLFAQAMHPAMKYVAPIRKKLAVETIFNILGPLTNPACATHQIVGVYSRDYVTPLAGVLQNLGLRRAMVVHGNDGLDEITTTDMTFISEFNGTEIRTYDIAPEELGFIRASLTDLQGGDLQTNIDIFNRILDGDRGPKRDIVVLNAAYALYVAERAASIPEGIELAKESIDSGKARKKLDELVEFCYRIKRINKGKTGER